MKIFPLEDSLQVLRGFEESSLKFADLNFDPSLQSAIDKMGYTECTPIQEQAFPLIVEGKDVAGLAQTGTGKTAAFLIPLMERILRARPQPPDLSEEQKALVEKRAFKDWRAQNFVLVLVPTRELAEQVMENIAKFGEASGLRGVAVYGGTSYEKQREGFRQGVEFVAATPGRLIDLYKDNLVDLKQVRAIVFDEADRMFDMGFKDDMKFILQRVPRERQYLVFSATLNFEVTNTAYQFGSEPIEINISRDQAKAENVKDTIFHTGNEDKPGALLSLLKMTNPKQAIIFTNFKMNVDRIAKFLLDNGVHAMGISSLLTQAQRNKVMEAFKADNEKNILVATDVAARGLDIKGVDLVINYELPQDAESYVHRIGRTGRAGETGTAFSLVSDRDVDSLMRIEEYLKHKLETGFIEDKDLVKDYKNMRYGEVNPGDLLAQAFNEGRPPREGNGGGGRKGGGRDRAAANAEIVAINGVAAVAVPPEGVIADRREGREPREGQAPREPRAEGQAPREGQPRTKPTPRDQLSAQQREAHGKPREPRGERKTAQGHRGNGSEKPRRQEGRGSKAAGKISRPIPRDQQGLGFKVKSFFRRILGN